MAGRKRSIIDQETWRREVNATERILYSEEAVWRVRPRRPQPTTQTPGWLKLWLHPSLVAFLGFTLASLNASAFTSPLLHRSSIRISQAAYQSRAKQSVIRSVLPKSRHLRGQSQVPAVDLPDLDGLAVSLQAGHSWLLSLPQPLFLDAALDKGASTHLKICCSMKPETSCLGSLWLSRPATPLLDKNHS